MPWPMRRLLSSHSCTSVQAEGWSGIRNSDLLQRAEARFDLLITSDQNLRYQQNLASSGIAILELSTNDLRRIQAASVLIEEAIEKIQSNEFRHFGDSVASSDLRPPTYDLQPPASGPLTSNL